MLRLVAGLVAALIAPATIASRVAEHGTAARLYAEVSAALARLPVR